MYQGDREASQPAAVVLAGGRATRLGPLTAQMNKALVSVGQRPILGYQLEALRNYDVNDVTIVVSPGQVDQVSDFVHRSHAGLRQRINIVVQETPLGPAHALGVGLRQTLDHGGPIFVLMADTFFEPLELHDARPDDWVGVEFPPTKRGWCYWDWKEWVEGETESHEVAVGLYRFNDRERLEDAVQSACMDSRGNGEYPMAPVLNAYGGLRRQRIASWHDVGDVKALSHARRHNFLSRSFNHLSLDQFGRVIKIVSEDQVDEINMLVARPGIKSIWPEVYDAKVTSVAMEFIDLPTLAELYLFWPGLPDMWAYILQDFHARMQVGLWLEPRHGGAAARAERMYCEKMMARFNEWEHPVKKHEVLRINDITYRAGEPLLAKFHRYLKLDVAPNAELASIHGDLNFSNILYSLGTGTFKLVDPRGNWGGEGWAGDQRYEIAKLRYSYADHFCSITHGLFECYQDEEEITLRFGPEREEERLAMDRVLLQFGYDIRHIKAIEASIFLSAMPLHDGLEQVALYAQGVKLANEVLG